MRKIVLFFFIILYTLGQAQDQPSSLQVRMWDNSLFAAVFAGDENGKYQRAYNVRSLEGGEYYLRIMQRNADDIETIFEGQIEIPPAARVQAIVQEDGSLEITTLEDLQRSPSSFDLKTQISNMQSKTKGPANSSAKERNQLIEPLELADLSNEMTRAASDRLRDSIGIAGLSRNLFTTSYIVQLTKLFKNETSRLEFTKSAYIRVVDPENYFQVKMLFKRKEDADSLEMHMQQNLNKTQRRESQGLF
jgi:hypothetical protein